VGVFQYSTGIVRSSIAVSQGERQSADLELWFSHSHHALLGGFNPWPRNDKDEQRRAVAHFLVNLEEMSHQV